ncbi:unnamed protein product [Urochloa humidicola]
MVLAICTIQQRAVLLSWQQFLEGRSTSKYSSRMENCTLELNIEIELSSLGWAENEGSTGLTFCPLGGIKLVKSERTGKEEQHSQRLGNRDTGCYPFICSYAGDGGVMKTVGILAMARTSIPSSHQPGMQAGVDLVRQRKCRGRAIDRSGVLDYFHLHGGQLQGESKVVEPR